MIYSLNKYKVIIDIPQKLQSLFGKNSLSIGGNGSYLESIEVRTNNDLWTVKGDYVGSYVHTMNRDKTGEITITLSQLSDYAILFHRLIESYYNTTSYDYIKTITVMEGDKIVATITDSMLKKVVDKRFGTEAQTESWTFVSGEITFNY